MIDKKGNIFGKINVIDLFLVLVVLIACIFIFNKLINPNVTLSQDDITMTFYVEKAPSYVAESIKVGTEVKDEAKGTSLGIITDVEIGPGYQYVATSEGELVRGYMEGYNSVKVTTQVKGQYTENGVIISGNQYNIGHSLTFYAGEAKLYGTISGASKGW